MTQKEIKMAGKTYPVVFTLKTMMNFEEITGKSFFNESFETMKSRISLIISAIIAADADTDITLEQLTNAETWEAAQEIINAYVAVMELSAKFFKLPEVEPKDEPAPAEAGDEKEVEPKN